MSLKNGTPLNFGSGLFDQDRSLRTRRGIPQWKLGCPEGNSATKSQRGSINTQPQHTTLAEKDKKLIKVYASSNVRLYFFKSTVGTSYPLWKILRWNCIVNKFVSTLTSKTGTAVPSIFFFFRRGIPRISVRRA